ncbi:MAG: insulinase family protein [Betaproteobacteria bacterium]|nr:insulinase family protein [Betaproteobacteria bacterium]
MNSNQKLNVVTLANGLRFIHAKGSETASFELSVHIDTGSRDETTHTNGVSHFLEHMMFRGSERLPNSVALAAAMESFGGEANAMTSIENTVYWLRGSARRLEEAFEIFSEFFLRPNFADLETERDIILQELANDYNEAGDNIDCETLAMGSMFPGQSIGLPIIGTEESIQRLTLAELRQKHSEYYTPKSCILTLVSPFDTEIVTRFAEKTFGQPWTHARNTTPTRAMLPEDYFNQSKPKRTLVLQNNSDNQYVFKLMLPGAGGLNEKVVHDIIVERLLDDGISSRLPATIREKHGLVYDISADAQSYADVGTFSIDATISQNCMQRLLDALLIELVRICQEPPSPEELQRLKFRYLFDLEVMGENHSRLITREVTQMFLNIKLPLGHESEIVQSITPESVQQTAKKILTHPRQTVVLVGPRARKFRSSIEKFLDQLTRCGG